MTNTLLLPSDVRMKPQQWGYDPGLVAPEGQAYGEPLFALPFWDGGGAPGTITRPSRFPTLNGTPTWEPANYGPSMDFATGSSESLRFGTVPEITVPIVASRQLTVVALVSTDVFAQDNRIVTIWDPTGGTPANDQFILWFDTGGVDGYAMAVKNTDETTFVAGDDVASGIQGQAHVVVGVLDGSFVRIYVDGVLKDSAAFTGTLGGTASSVLRIGEIAGGGYHDGKIGMVLIYDRGFSHAEVVRITADPFGPFRMAELVIGRVPVAAGRIMGALAGHGGLAGVGGIAGRRGGIAG